MKYKITDDGEIAKIEYSDRSNSHLMVSYKNSSEKGIPLGYKIGKIEGLIRLQKWDTPFFDEILGRMECAMSDEFLFILRDVLMHVNHKRLLRMGTLVFFWDSGLKKEAQDIAGFGCGTLVEKTIKDYRRRIKEQEYFLGIMQKMKMANPQK
jgi:hypothetical protein